MKKLVIVIIGAFLIGACSKLEVVPRGADTSANFFQTEEDAVAAVTATYAGLATPDLYNQFIEVYSSQGTDDAEWGYGRNTSNPDKNQLDKFTFDAGTNLVYRMWYQSYIVINRTNFAVKGINGMDNLSSTLKNRLLAEAMFVRALCYFNLVRFYGDVPLMLEPTEGLGNLAVERSPTEDVYAQIEIDFSFASQHLPTTYGGSDVGRATKGAALTLLAKMYLTRGEYQRTAELADQVIDLGVYALWDDYADVFAIKNKNLRESIFEIQFATGPGNVNSSFAGYYRPSFDRRQGFGGYGDNPVTQNHFLAYPIGDLRKNVNVIEYSRSVEPIAPASILYPYYVAKFKDPEATNPENGGNNFIVTRYADLLLMKAEALSQLDPADPQAYDAFNQVRRRAYGFPIGIPSSVDLQPGLSRETFLDSVLFERRLELAFEGHRRFDLIRTGKLIEAMNAQDPSIMVEQRHYLLPIPTMERNVNALLTQNEGY